MVIDEKKADFEARLKQETRKQGMKSDYNGAAGAPEKKSNSVSFNKKGLKIW